MVILRLEREIHSINTNPWGGGMEKSKNYHVKFQREPKVQEVLIQ